MIISILRIQFQRAGAGASSCSSSGGGGRGRSALVRVVALTNDAVAEGVDDVEDGLVGVFEEGVHEGRGERVHVSYYYVGARAEAAPDLGGAFGEGEGAGMEGKVRGRGGGRGGGGGGEEAKVGRGNVSLAEGWG